MLDAWAHMLADIKKHIHIHTKYAPQILKAHPRLQCMFPGSSIIVAPIQGEHAQLDVQGGHMDIEHIQGCKQAAASQ